MIFGRFLLINFNNGIYSFPAWCSAFMGRLWRTNRQVCLLCPWARHLTGRPTFIWKTGDPEMATPKRVRTYHPKHGDTSLSGKWRINMANKKKVYTSFLLVPCQPGFQPSTIVFYDRCTIHAPYNHWQNCSNHGNINTFE